MADEIWLINTTDKTYSYCSKSWSRFVDFPPGRPVSFPKWEALMILKGGVVNECRDPDRYFLDRPYKTLIIRDQGLGDLLLLEPVIREYKKTSKSHITLATMFPEIYRDNPNVDEIIFLNAYSDTKSYDVGNYDRVIELRMWSERSPNSGKKNRTLVYNEMFGNMEIKDLEPKLHMTPEINVKFRRESAKKYIGIQLDATEPRRRYVRGLELADHILKMDSSAMVVVFGSRMFVDLQNLDSGRIIDLQGRTTLRQAINCIRDLDGMIATDSGLMHVAAALHIPVVGLFSLIPAHLRLSNYSGPIRTVAAEIPCIGCCNRGGPTCNESSRIACMDLNPSKLWDPLCEMVPEKADNVGIDKISAEMEGVKTSPVPA